MAVQRVCDFCLSEGKNNVPAIGWYVGANIKRHDVCKKHANDAEEVGREIYYY